MNKVFNGELVVIKGCRKPKGSTSKAAKQAFKDILADKDMRVTIDCYAADGRMIKMPCILNEDILIDCPMV